MTNTPHLHLHTWALSDPVSVAEMNENFTAIDEASARSNAKENLHESAIIRSAYQSAKSALRTYHGDDTAYDDKGIWLADFSKGASQVQEVSNLRFVNGSYILPHIAQESVTLTVSDATLDGGESQSLGTITIEGFGTLESITPATVGGNDNSKIRYSLVFDGKVVGQTALTTIEEISGNAVKLIEPLEVWPGMQLTLSAYGSNGGISNAHVFVGESITLDITPCAHEEGWAQGRSFSADGASQALIWLYWTGTGPTVELWQNTQAEVLTPVNMGTSRFIDGTNVHCAYYRAALAAVGDPSLRFYPPANTRMLGGMALCI